jgi:amino acid transporter
VAIASNIPGTNTSAGQLKTADVIARQLKMLPLVGVIFFSVSGGPYGLEDAVSSSGPGMTMLMLLVVPIVFSVPCALMSAELGAAIPLEGGYYYWVKLALGKGAGFIEGAWSWLNGFLDTALYPIVFADYMAQWIPGIGRGDHVWFSFFGGALSIDTHWLVAVGFMVPLALLNVRGSRLVGDSTILMMVVVLAPFAILSVYGIVHLARYGGTNPLHPFLLPGQSAFNSFGAGLGVLIWNYIGWDAPSTVLGEVDRPQRTYGRALLLAVPLITLSYVLPMIASLASGLHSGHTGDWTDGDFANAASLLAGNWLKVLITIGAVVANVGLFSSLLMSGSRIPRVLAGDSYLPQWVARDHPRYGTPARAIAISCVIFAVFCAMDFNALIDADVITNLAAILLEFAAFLVLRQKYRNMRRPYRVPGGWFGAALITAGPVIFTVWLAWNTFTDEPNAFWVGMIILVIGVVAYPLTSRYIKQGRPDAIVDSAAVDLGDGLDAAALLTRS